MALSNYWTNINDVNVNTAPLTQGRFIMGDLRFSEAPDPAYVGTPQYRLNGGAWTNFDSQNPTDGAEVDILLNPATYLLEVQDDNGIVEMLTFTIRAEIDSCGVMYGPGINTGTDTFFASQSSTCIQYSLDGGATYLPGPTIVISPTVTLPASPIALVIEYAGCLTPVATVPHPFEVSPVTAVISTELAKNPIEIIIFANQALPSTRIGVELWVEDAPYSTVFNKILEYQSPLSAVFNVKFYLQKALQSMLAFDPPQLTDTAPVICPNVCRRWYYKEAEWAVGETPVFGLPAEIKGALLAGLGYYGEITDITCAEVITDAWQWNNGDSIQWNNGDDITLNN